jgi:hypothetical protein
MLYRRTGRGFVSRFRQPAIKPIAISIEVCLGRFLPLGFGVELVVGVFLHGIVSRTWQHLNHSSAFRVPKTVKVPDSPRLFSPRYRQIQ